MHFKSVARRLGLGLVATLVASFAVVPTVLAAPGDYTGGNYVQNGFTITLNDAPADGSNTFLAGIITGGTAFIGNKRQTININGQPTPCPLDLVLVANGNAVYYRFNAAPNGGNVGGAIPGLGAFDACKQAMNINGNYNGLASTAKVAVNTGEEATPQETCEDVVWLGGLICPLVDGARSIVEAVYGTITQYMHFTLYQPVTGDDIGTAGVNAQTYNGLKSAWQTFARLASLVVVAGFLLMIIASSAAGKS